MKIIEKFEHYVPAIAALCGSVLLCLIVLGGGKPVEAQTIQSTGTTVEATLRDFYAARDFKPLWTGKGGGFTSHASRIPAILDGARAHGLDPETYGVSQMRAMLGAEKPVDANGWKQAELYWSYNIWAYASDLMGQKADATTLSRVVAGNITDRLSSLAPDTPLYRDLQERLARADAHMPSPDDQRLSFGRTFKPGMSSAAVPSLRARMVAYGATPKDTADDIYDEDLAKAVSRFQTEHVLDNDGTIGPMTLGILNRAPSDERPQILANLQRLREPHRRMREDRRIDVSIASYQLTAYDDGQPVMTMPVVVGQPRRQTISFRTEITGVRINPTWTVPTTIKKQDIIPQLLTDPAKMVRKHNVKLFKDGQALDPQSVDWSQWTPHELMQVRFTAPSGDSNPLGRYRVIMENPYDIYLHDTNHKELFDISMRAQSSGCVRVARPDDLADFILGTKKDWNRQKTANLVASNRTADVIIENKIPIYLDYVTAWFNDRRQLVLGPDIYGLDKPRYDALTKNALTTQRNAQKILTRVSDIIEPALKEAQHGEAVLTHTTN
jgi:murein L,D-transpeptidase YcbB/YkuD